MMLSRFMTPREQLLLLGLTLALAVGAVSLYVHDRSLAHEPAASEDGVLERKARPSDVKAPPALSERIDLNTASQAELESLPGIGPKLAAEIIRYRASAPFRSVDDVTNVPGIGPKKLEALRPFVMVP